MFQLSLTVLLALSISANFVYTIEIFEADTTNLQNESPVGVLKNNNQTVESSKSHEELSKNVTKIDPTLEKDQRKVDTSQATKNETTTLSTQDTARSIEKVIPTSKKENVTQKPTKLSDEKAKMNPLDKDKKDVVMIETSKKNATSSGSTLGTTPSSIKTTLSSSIADTTTSEDSSSSPEFYPVKNIGHESGNITGSLNGSMYKTFPPNLEHVTETTTSEISNSTVVTKSTTNNITIPVVATTKSTPVVVTTKSTPIALATNSTPAALTTKSTPAVVTAKTTPIVVPTPTVANTTDATDASTVLTSNQTQSGNDKITVEGVGNLQQTELTEKNKSDGSKNESMPPGVIALVTAITFAVAIAIGYISMVVWKQYIEHRYGRRELLVNELEFDTNDLRHFEL